MPENSGIWRPQNVKEIQRYGLDVTTKFDTQINKAFVNITFQYSWLRALTIASFIENDASLNKQLMYVPEHQFKCSFDIVLSEIRLFYYQTITGSIFIDGQNESYLPYYAPANLGIEWKSKFIKGKQLLAGFKIMNLFNEDYHVVSFHPMPGLHMLFNLKLNLKNKN